MKVSSRTYSGSYLIDFAPAFTVLVLVIFPLIDLMGLLCGGATVQFLAYRACCAASVEQRFQDSLSSMENQSNAICTSGLGSFSRLRPVDGYNNAGSDLFLMVTNIYTSQANIAPANSPAAGPIDTTSNLYECAVVSTCEVGPVISLSGVPFICNVPGLGKPAVITGRWVRAWEHPSAAASAGTGAFSGGTSSIKLSSVSGLGTPGTLTNLTGSGWNYPNIYALIAAAGQVPVTEQVLELIAKEDWRSTDVTLQPGDKLWVDVTAIGSWSTGPGNGNVDADGLATLGQDPYGNNYGAMVGKIGVNGTPFTVGKKMWNMLPAGSGQLYLICNDAPGANFDNRGGLEVRLIVAR